MRNNRLKLQRERVIHVTTIALISIFLSLLVGCEPQEAPTPPPKKVKAIQLGEISALVDRNFPGRARAAQEVNLSFRVSGPLIEFPVKVGESVKEGDLIARIDPTDFESRVKTMRGKLSQGIAARDVAAAEFKRAADIRKKNSDLISASEFDKRQGDRDNTQAQLLALESGLKLAEDDLAYTFLTAPFDGVIAATYVENFENVVAKRPIARVLDTDRIEVVIDIPERYIIYAPFVVSATVSFEALAGIALEAKVEEIGNEASAVTRTYPVTLIMDQPEGVEIKPGMAANVKLVGKLPEQAREVGMSIPAQAIERKTLTRFIVFLMLVGGIFSYFQLGRLEDPDFTIKTAVIATQYPGASAEEVELEVTDRIELALQEMPELDNMYSLSRAGLSIIKVDIKEVYWADRLPQVWNIMRNKLRDIQPSLPTRALAPEIMDDFSFVYGFVLAVTGDGYSYAELEDYVDYLKKDLSLVEGVARVELWGVQPKVIYLDVSEAQVAAMGLTMEDVLLTLASQNAVVPAGHVEVPDRRLRLEVTGEFDSPEDIGKLQLRRSLADIARNFVRGETESDVPQDSTSELVRIEDIATVRTGYLEPSITRMRFNGQEALAVSLANVAGGNVVMTGRAIDKRLAELVAELPAGINVTRFAWQSDEVKASIDAFIINLAEAVLIVLVVITLAMGWRMGVVIGSALILTILATFIVMSVAGIELHRVSLGALVVALGMMVDNSIVVADGMAVRLGRGWMPKRRRLKVRRYRRGRCWVRPLWL